MPTWEKRECVSGGKHTIHKKITTNIPYENRVETEIYQTCKFCDAKRVFKTQITPVSSKEEAIEVCNKWDGNEGSNLFGNHWIILIIFLTFYFLFIR